MAFWNTLDEYKNSFPRGEEEWARKQWIEHYKWNVMKHDLPQEETDNLSYAHLRNRLGN